MVVYGAGNEKRMTGEHETASFDTFSWGVANRGTSVRIGNETLQNECGYFEDRRPSSNMNPYLVTAKIYDTTTIWNGLQEPNSVNTLNEGGEYQLVNDTTQNIEKNIDLVINDTMEFVGDVCDF
jgi:glutamine synthetase